MMFSRIAMVAVMVLALGAAAEAAGVRNGARADRKNRRVFDPDSISGRIVAVATLKDKTDTIIVVKSARQRGVPASNTAVIANGETKVVVEGVDSRLVDLKPGHQVKLTANGSNATRIELTSTQRGQNKGGQNGKRGAAKAGRK